MARILGRHFHNLTPNCIFVYVVFEINFLCYSISPIALEQHIVMYIFLTEPNLSLDQY